MGRNDVIFLEGYHDLATFTLINDILVALNNKLLVGGTFCDLQKAFDCVDHAIFLAKMYQYGIIGKSHKLITSYLENRNQRVIITSKSKPYYSEWKPTKQGVPQGSILGPLLFLIYINDLPRHIQPLANIVLFADDTSMIIKSVSHTEFATALQRNITIADKWFKSNLLNTNKTHLLQFRTKSDQIKDLRIYYGKKRITTVNTIKFLGIIIDSSLSWKQHIDNIVPKLNKACFAVRLVKPYMTTEIFKNAIFFIFSFSPILQNYFLGKLGMQSTHFQNSKEND